MSRYIDLDKYKKWDGIPKCRDCRHSYVITDYCIECYYKNGGEEDVRPVVHAKWERHSDGFCLWITCSNCDYDEAPLGSKFCPFCGAIMDKE